jgi:hypothetical protein
VRFEHLGALREYARSNLVEARQQVVRAVVRERGAGDSHDPSTATRERNAWMRWDIFVSRAWRDYQVRMTELA